MESGVTGQEVAFSIQSSFYCWFSLDVTKIQTKNYPILRRFYFHDALEKMKTNDLFQEILLSKQLMY